MAGITTEMIGGLDPFGQLVLPSRMSIQERAEIIDEQRADRRNLLADIRQVRPFAIAAGVGAVIGLVAATIAESSRAELIAASVVAAGVAVKLESIAHSNRGSAAIISRALAPLLRQ